MAIFSAKAFGEVKQKDRSLEFRRKMVEVKEDGGGGLEREERTRRKKREVW